MIGIQGASNFYQDYFSDDPTFVSDLTRNFVRIMFCTYVHTSLITFFVAWVSNERCHVFVRIMNVAKEHVDYFVQKGNAADILGLSCL